MGFEGWLGPLPDIGDALVSAFKDLGAGDDLADSTRGQRDGLGDHRLRDAGLVGVADSGVDQVLEPGHQAACSVEQTRHVVE